LTACEVQPPAADAGSLHVQAYVAYSNTSSQPRPAVIVVPDYDGIGNYERW